MAARSTRSLLRPVLWLAWVVIFGAATLHLWRWHLDYFKSPGAQFYRIATLGFPAVAVAAWVYALIRRRFLRRYEPLAVLLLTAAVCGFYEPRAAAVVSLLFLSCTAAGNFLLRRFGVTLNSPLERITLGFGAGAGMLISILTLAGFARLLYPAVFLTVLVLPLLALPGYIRESMLDFRELNRNWQHSPGASHPLTGVAMVFGYLAIACTLMIALAPSIAFDPVAFHLPSVEFYATQHALQPVPNIDYSYYPQGFEMLWTLGFSLAGQAGAQLISAVFFLVFLLTLLRLARQCGLSPGAAALAAIFAATTPFIHWSGSVTKNDMAMALFEALALYGFLRWLRGHDFRWIIVATFFLAQAFGIKYVALFGAIPLALCFAYAVWRERSRWRAAAVLAIIFTVFGVSWMARAYWLTGNPVAPQKLGAAAGEGLTAHRTLRRKIVRLVQLPGTVLFHGEDAFESPLPNPAGILVIALAPLALLAGAMRPTTRAPFVCALFTLLYLLYWGMLLDKVRYAILPFALIAIWLASCAVRFYDSESTAVRLSLIVVMTYSLLIGVMALMIVGINGPQLEYFAGKLDKPGYLRAAMHAYGAVEYVRLHDDGHPTVFGVDDVARLYSADPTRFDGVLCGDRVRACAPERIAGAVRGEHAGYLILPEGRAWTPLLMQLGDPPRVYGDAFFSVYRLRLPPVPGAKMTGVH